jgi:hypothetical protein
MLLCAAPPRGRPAGPPYRAAAARTKKETPGAAPGVEVFVAFGETAALLGPQPAYARHRHLRRKANMHQSRQGRLAVARSRFRRRALAR